MSKLPDAEEIMASLGVPRVEGNPLIRERSKSPAGEPPSPAGEVAGITTESLRYDTAGRKVWAFWDQYKTGDSPLTKVEIYAPGGIIRFTLRGEVTMDCFEEIGLS